MIAQHAQRFRQLCIVGETDTRLSIRSQVFAAIETEAGNVAETAHALALVGGSVRLGSIFDDAQTVSMSEIHDGLHLCRVAIQVDGNDGARMLAQYAFQMPPVH